MRRCPARLSLLAHLALIAFLLPALAAAQQSGTPADEAAIRAVIDSESDAWNHGDAEAFAARYAANGSFTNILGQQLYGKPAFVKQHAMIFSTIYKGSHNVFSIGMITFLRPDVAVVDIDGILSGATRLPPGMKPAPDGALHVKLQQVMTREHGQWWIAAFHNVAVTPLPPAS